jgi:hypothetical protein
MGKTAVLRNDKEQAANRKTKRIFVDAYFNSRQRYAV